MKNFLSSITITVVIILVFYKLFNGFFVQDEWHAFGYHILLSSLDAGSFLKEIFLASGFHYTPLTVLFIHLLFILFKISYPSYMGVSLFLHIITTLLFLVFAKNILGNFKLALLAAILFGVNSAGFQTTAWPVADIGTHGSTIFGFLSLIFFLKFIKKKDIKTFAASLALLIVSLLFKENAIGFFLLMPAMLYLFGARIKQDRFKFILYIFLIGFVYFIFRVLIFNETVHVLSQTSIGQSARNVVYNLFSVPVKSAVQSFVPSFQTYDIAHLLANFFPKEITGDKGSPVYESFVLKRIFEGLNFVIFLIMLAICLICFKIADKRRKEIIIFCALFIFVNSLIFVFAPEKMGIIFTIDSRNLYLIASGTILLLATLLSVVKNQKLTTISLLVYLALNTWWLNDQINTQVEESRVRKEILNQIQLNYPVIQQKSVFYTESDSSFYGLSSNERILPFQSGFGQTLLVRYGLTQNIPYEYFRNDFLWKITDQGYKEVGDTGFGYFRDFDLLVKTIRDNNIDPLSLIAFRYDSSDKNVYDISTEVQGRIEGYLSKKEKVTIKKDMLTASENNVFKSYLVDGNRETSWVSDSSYNNSQYILFDLKNTVKIAQIDIDTYNNKDQDQVGFKIYISNDNENWKQIFYSKKYPPNKEGMIEIYLDPHPARYLKIEQAGFHQYAPWVIHEMEIYESFE